jgi:hypothetical protein
LTCNVANKFTGIENVFKSVAIQEVLGDILSNLKLATGIHEINSTFGSVRQLSLLHLLVGVHVIDQ